MALVAITPGPEGEGTAVTVTETTAPRHRRSGDSPHGLRRNYVLCQYSGAPVTTNNPAIPGEMVYVLATGLGVTTPQTVATGQIFEGGSLNPLATQVDSILTGGTTANPVSVGLVPAR